MNFGAFAGGMAQAGMNTYLNLSQNQRAQDEQDARNQARAREEADRQLAQRTLGRADTVQNVPNPETPETEAVGLGYTPTKYTRDQAYEEYSRGVSDPKLMVQYAGLADQHKKQRQIEEIAKAAQYWQTNPLQAVNAISQVYSQVPDGFSTQGIDVNGKPVMLIRDDKTGAVLQQHDMSDPMVQNIATLRAMAAIDPDKYNPLFQQAMVQYTQLNNQGQQIKETGRHNVANEGIAQQQVGIARDKLVQDGRQHDDLMDFRYYQDDGVNQRAQAQIGLYERGLRGGAGRGAGAGDPYKQTREARQAQAAFIKNNPSLYSFTPEGTDKPVTHAGMLTLTNNLYQTTDEATTQQVLMGIQAQAQQAAVDPQTGRMDYAKYRAALDKGTADVMNHLAQKKAGSGAAPNDAPTPAGGTPDVEARNPTNVPGLRQRMEAQPQSKPAAGGMSEAKSKGKSWKETVAEKEAGYAKAAKIEDDPKWKELQAAKQAAAKAGKLDEARRILKEQEAYKASFGK